MIARWHRQVWMVLMACAAGCGREAQTDQPVPPSAADRPVTHYTYEIVRAYPHDRNAFTQGLSVEGNTVYESTGLKGASTLRAWDLETGEILRVHALPADQFGEGCTLMGNRVYQLTWKSNLGYVYDKDTFEEIKRFRYPTEGWGLTHDETSLIMTDGSSRLYYVDPEDFSLRGVVEVRDRGRPLTGLNELEFVEGEVWANIWKTERLARIDPLTGRVLGWIDLGGLKEQLGRAQRTDVLNGIAYDPSTRRLFVTGKLWPKLFEIRVIPREPLETNGKDR